MKAVECTKYGPPEVLRLTDVKKPAPKKNEVLIKIHTTAATASDCIIRGAKLPLSYQIPMRLMVGITKPRKILGLILAGEVESIGSAVTRFKAGDQVYGFTEFGFGTYAEYKCMPESSVLARKPSNLNYEEAAAIPYGGLLALHFLRKGAIQSGQNILIYGASGAIGTAAVQIAKHFGATVTGVCSTRNLELVTSLGADAVIDYTREELTGRTERYDLVLDAVGRRKSSALKEQAQNALSPNGKSVSVDDGTPRFNAEQLALLTEIVEAGHLKPIIDKTFPLEEIVEAHRYVDAGHKKGNVVITVNHTGPGAST